MYLPIHLNFLFKKNSFYLQTVFSKQFLTPTFSSIKNLILSSMRGFKKYLRIRGLGFKVFLEKKFLKFHLGFSHFNYFKILDTLKIKVAGVKSRTIKIIGLNLNLVNQAGFLIRKFRNPGSYNYKGIYFLRENFFLKEGKKKKFR